MAFKDFFDINTLFSPEVYYDGESVLGGEFDFTNGTTDYLMLNSKVINKQNMYEQYLEKYFYKPLRNIINSDSLTYAIFPKICLGVSADDNRRKATFSFSCFLAPQIININSAENLQALEDLGDDANLEQLIQFLKEIIRKERLIYSDVIANGKNSLYYEEVSSLYNGYIQSGVQMSFADFLHYSKEGCTKRIMATRYYRSLFSEEINIPALLECFEYDKFCLIAAKSVLDTCMTTETIHNRVDNSIVYLRKYLEMVQLYRQIDTSYNCYIVTIDKKSGKKKMINIDDIAREYEALLARHPKFKFVTFMAEDVSKLLKSYGYADEFIANFDFKSKDAETLMALLAKIEEDRTLLASWTIIPKGTRKDEDIKESEKREYEEHFSVSENEKVRRMIIGRDFLENSDYLFRLQGMNVFEGYIGYMYANGSVVFEKYYENIRTRKVASGNATYVMGLYNFVDLSKLSKLEIIKRMNNGNLTGVRRIFHREDMDRWKAEVKQAIAGSDYTDQVINYIDTLVSDRVIDKKGVKS